MPTFTTPGPIKVTLEVAGAQVRVNASDRADTVVLIEPVDAASRKDVKVAEKTTVDFFGGQLTVTTKTAGDRSGSVAITIDVPAGSGLDVSMAHSSVRTDGPLGECELNLASGRIQLDRIDALRASLAAGEVEVGHIAGRANISGAGAAVRIGEVEGAVKLVGSSGPVWIGAASADLDLTNSNGGFDIGRADGSVTAMTGGNGVIRIGRMARGHAELVNASGDIEVGVGQGTAVRVEADSKYGSVRNSVPPRDEPAAADLLTVHARTRRGDIVVQPAAG